MDKKTKERIEEIQKRLDRYYNNKPNPDIFSKENLLDNAPEDISFLLKLAAWQQQQLDKLKRKLFEYCVQENYKKYHKK